MPCSRYAIAHLHEEVAWPNTASRWIHDSEKLDQGGSMIPKMGGSMIAKNSPSGGSMIPENHSGIHTESGDPAEVCEAIEIIFGLLRSIGEEPDEIIFFANEAGTWQVGVDWSEVLPVWFLCLSATTEPEEYARRVVQLVDQHDSYNRTKHFTAARKAGTPAQAKALGPQRRRKKGTR
jgi:hypothetical protein